MCHENPNLDAALNAMEAAAEQLSLVQDKINAPMFDLLFQLVNLPQTPGIAGAKLKVLHTYTHRFMEFYMTECPDGISIQAINVNAVHAISSKLRSLGDGLARLLAYLGLERENEKLTEYVDNLAVAYDSFAAMMSRVDAIHNAYYPEDDECACCECDEGCCGDCFSHCGCSNCDDEEYDDEEEDEPSDSTAECSPETNTKEREDTEKLFNQVFGCKPDATEQQKVAEPTADNNETDDATDDMVDAFAGLLAAALGSKEGMKTAAAAVQRMEERKRQNKMPAESQPEPKATEANQEDYLAEMLSKMLGVPKENIRCTVKREQKRVNNPDAFFEHVMRNRLTSFPFREVYPGFWRFML